MMKLLKTVPEAAIIFDEFACPAFVIYVLSEKTLFIVRCLENLCAQYRL